MPDKKTPIEDLLENAKDKKASSTKLTGLARRASLVIEGEKKKGRDIVAFNHRSLGPIFYYIDNRNVVHPLPPYQLESLVNDYYPNDLARPRKEIMALIQQQVSKTAPFDRDAVQSVAFADELNKLTFNRLSISRANIANITIDDVPEFKAVRDRTSDPTALELWLGSCLHPGAGRTKALCLNGHGGDGKSRLLMCITKVLGFDRCVRSQMSEIESTHFGEDLEGASLLAFADTNNPSAVSSGKFKELTGEGELTINPKHQKRRNIRLTHKTIILSNIPIEISSLTADRRRLLMIDIAPDPEISAGKRATWWYEGIYEKAEQMMAYCFNQFEKAIALDPATLVEVPQSDEAIEAAIERKYQEITNTILSSYTMTGADSDATPKAELHDEIFRRFNERRTNRAFLSQVKEALVRMGVKEGFRSGGVAVYRGIKAGATTDVSSAAVTRSKLVAVSGGNQ